ncbi:MAG: hypothetical protein ACQERJ_00870 [Bacillota bacterium]
MNQKKTSILFIFIILICTPVSLAQNNTVDLKLGRLNGTTDYTISGPADGGWKSELVFPLESKIITLNYENQLKDTIWGVKRFNFSIMNNLDKHNNGLMKDSDWLYSYDTNKVIYSETEADLNALSAQIEFIGSRHYTDNTTYSLLIGYKYNNFDYIIHDGIQYDYINDTQTTITGEALAYEVKYHLPYLGFQLETLQSSPLNWQFALNLAPYIKAQDVDDHILRYKKSTGTADGSAIILNSSINYDLTPDLSFLISGEYSTINTTGEQKQYFYAGPQEGTKISDIQHTINLESYTISAAIEYLF